jgi:A/G-specific adenine glycosylase
MSHQLGAAATAWYDANARDLPWRASGTSAWAVLVSEIMLQQTPVSRVLPVWREWLDRWPTPHALAAQPAGEAIRAWGRLGYPRRALRLHECAQAIVARRDGSVPSNVDELLTLPGIGTYTARAVAVFAYGQRHAVVDTNVRRVVARALGGLRDAGATTSTRDLAAVEGLLPADPAAAARTSIAFMELGALVCTARNPACASCPLLPACAFQNAGASRGGGATAAQPTRRRPQRYAGTDRQVRGLLLAVLREARGPVPAARLDAVWRDSAQRDRALAGLVADGLVGELSHRRYALPGTATGSPG